MANLNGSQIACLQFYRCVGLRGKGRTGISQNCGWPSKAAKPAPCSITFDGTSWGGFFVPASRWYGQGKQGKELLVKKLLVNPLR